MTAQERVGLPSADLNAFPPFQAGDAPLGDVPPPSLETPAGKTTPTLDQLRARIQAVLERHGKKAPAPPRDPDEELPFAVETTPSGPLHVRTLELLPSHRTGRASVLPSKHASPDLLSYLALDPALRGCDPTRALYLDTETTGLSGGTGTLAFLVGLAFWVTRETEEEGVASTLCVEQLLLRSPGEEAPILERVKARLERASMLVTFNGKAFDMPLLRTRFAMARLEPPREPPHLDLVHVARRVHTKGPATEGTAEKRPWGATVSTAYRLTSLEDRVLGFVREGDVPSGEVSACYVRFLRHGDAGAMRAVVDHNVWDVVAMASLVGLYGEPVATSALAAHDLVGLAKTLFRAGERSSALEAAERAVALGAGDAALLTRAELRKKAGEKARALEDFEALASIDASPRVNLELAKLYEHFKKDPSRALEACERGTTEGEEALARRTARLRRKLARETRRIGALF